MVATELVKIPKILFLDEPTSGLDTFNASLLVQCLKDLGDHYNTNIVMSIHQPRSNIFHSFDRLVVVNKGETTYVGPTSKVIPYLSSIGKQPPIDYNTADYLIDVLFMKEAGENGLSSSNGTDMSVSGGSSGNGKHVLVEKEEEGVVAIELPAITTTTSTSTPMGDVVLSSELDSDNMYARVFAKSEEKQALLDEVDAILK